MKRGTPEHPKVADLADRLGIPHYAAVGLLELLWHYTAQYAPKGDIGKFSDFAISRGCYWRKGADKLIQAFIDSGWLDPHPVARLVIHDWEDHMDNSAKKKLERQQEKAIATEVRNSTLYFIKATRSGNIKIGFTSSDPRARLDALQAGSHEPLELIGACYGTRQMERGLHLRFSRFKTHGEWFSQEKEIVDLIEDMCKNGKTLETVRDLLGPPALPCLALPEPEPIPQTPVAPDGASGELFDELAIDQQPVVRPDAPAKKTRPQSVWYDQQHESWYQAFWNHKGKIDSRKAYEKAINRIVDREGKAYNAAKLFLAEVIVEDRKRFEHTPDWDSRVKIHPATYLNGCRWEDEALVLNGKNGHHTESLIERTKRYAAEQEEKRNAKLPG